ncbi:hypothetical protein [Caballeronia sp. LjRoot31]|uniref:hypothetical protein n=1 Tax=Caballeronia sp. LjRoot31 TaxID=3342324 RepID=UPI003ED04EFC
MLDFAHYVSKVVASSSVDPLGTASVNMNLYRQVFPGINNRARYIRVYSALCWQVQQVLDTIEGRNLPDEAIQEAFNRGLEKMQLLLVWSNTALEERITQLPGSQRLWPKDNEPEQLNFRRIPSAKAATILEEDEEADAPKGAAFMSAPEYQPSITQGLGFLIPHAHLKGVYDLSDGGRALAKAFQRHLERLQHPKASWLSDPAKTTIRETDVKKLHPVLRLDSKPSRDEQAAFLLHYFPNTANVRAPFSWRTRHSGLTLALRAIAAEEQAEGANGFVDEQTIRHAMARGFARDGTKVTLDGLAPTQGVWSSLQLRQYLRLALDTLFRITECQVHHAVAKNLPREIDDIASAVGMKVQAALAGPISETLDALIEYITTLQAPHSTLYLAGCRDPRVDIAALFDALRKCENLKPESDKERQAAALCYFAFLFCAKESENFGAHPYFKRDEGDRLGFDELESLVALYRDATPGEFISHIVRDYTINQHFDVVRERTEDDYDNDRSPKNRYRFMLGDRGLARNTEEERDFSRVTFLQDLLRHALLLLSQAGLLEQRVVKRREVFRLTAEGRTRLNQTLDTLPLTA